MSIADEIKAIVTSGEMGDSDFHAQIERHSAFAQRVTASGVVLKKDQFSVPLAERIGTRLQGATFDADGAIFVRRIGA